MSAHPHFAALLKRAEPLPPIPTAVVAPEEENSLGGALLGADHTLITPILVGDAAKIHAAAKAIERDLSGYEIVDVRGHDEAAARAVELVHEGRAKALMKGHLHTDEFLHHVVKSSGGLRTKRRVSHVFALDIPNFKRMIMITDGAINVSPNLETKADIVRNAIDLSHSLGYPNPRVAILSATESVSPTFPATVEAAALSKMADRGQIKGGFVDGPFGMDNAVSEDAARIKGIVSPVAGRADVLVTPEIRSANMVFKALTFLAGAQAGGVVLGAKVPIMLTSRADDDKARLASCVLAALHAQNG